MTNVEARIKIKGKNFEIRVDLDKALEFKKGKNVLPQEFLDAPIIFSDIKKGLRISPNDLTDAFGTSEPFAIAQKIVKDGELQLPVEYKHKEQETKRKQVVDWISKNAVDPASGRPHTLTRIEDALDKAGVNITNQPVDEQIIKIIELLRPIIPIRIENKKLRIKVPSIYTGKVYGIVSSYKEKEEWLPNGDLSCVINLPVGLQMEFYDKLNAITHGSVIVEEMKS
jgi:ribosome maturation protein SDO1